jgi:rhombotail lipoprotein
MNIGRTIVTIIMSTALLAGCGTIPNRSLSSARFTDMIAPTRDSLIVQNKQPLTLPVSVAILILPARTYVPTASSMPDTALRQAADLLKRRLKENRKYISRVTIVTPDDHRDRMTLAQIQNLYGADVVIALSYQQDQRSSQGGLAALMDATVIGDFVIPGVKMITTTYVDGKIIHIPSNAIIFEASGSDDRTSRVTSYTAHGDKPTQESIDGLMAATDDFSQKIADTFTQLDHYDMSKAQPVNSMLAEGTPIPPHSVTPAANDNWNRVDNFKRSGGASNPFELSVLLGLCILFRRQAAGRRAGAM